MNNDNLSPAETKFFSQLQRKIRDVVIDAVKAVPEDQQEEAGLTDASVLMAVSYTLVEMCVRGHVDKDTAVTAFSRDFDNMNAILKMMEVLDAAAAKAQ